MGEPLSSATSVLPPQFLVMKKELRWRHTGVVSNNHTETGRLISPIVFYLFTWSWVRCSAPPPGTSPETSTNPGTGQAPGTAPSPSPGPGQSTTPDHRPRVQPQPQGQTHKHSPAPASTPATTLRSHHSHTPSHSPW